MLKVRGVYEWSLIDDKTGVVVDYGSQENTITDSLLYILANMYPPDNARIVLSTTATPLPSAEYRAYGIADGAIARTDVSTTLTPPTFDLVLRKATWVNNFSAPVSPRTITIFGLDLQDNSWRNIASFVELTTPITQTATQSLYVSYSLYLDFVSTGGLNAASNAYIEREIKRNMMTSLVGGPIMAPRGGAQAEYKSNPIFTAWGVDSLDLTKVMRAPNFWAHPSSGMYSLKEADEGTYAAVKLLLSLTTTNYYGPLGAVCFGRLSAYNGADAPSICHTVCPSTNLVPSISRVFAHPASRKRDVIFSDVAYPPSSRGIITLSGTPTNKWPWLTGRVHVTKTGDASDIVGGLVTGMNGNGYVTVGETGWSVNDQITVAGGALPSPLTGMNYYVAGVTGYDLTLSETQGSTGIQIDGDGSGTYERYNTGKYRLEYNSMITRHSAGAYAVIPTYYYTYTGHYFGQFQLPIDAEGTLYNSSDKIYSTMYWTQRMVWRKGDYCYSIHETAAAATKYQFAKWRYASVESVQPMFSFPKSTCTIYSAVRAEGTYVDRVFLATSDGVYEWDLTDPTTAPTKRTITGMIDSTVYEVTYDPVREYLWTGHGTGMSKVDLGANTATTYTIAGGQFSGGLIASEVACPPGSLDAYDGRVMCSHANGTFVVDDDYDGGGSIGWYRISAPSSVDFGGALRHKNRLQVVWRNNTTWYLYSLVITGSGTGTLTVLSSLVGTSYGGDGQYLSSPMIRLNDYSYGYMNREGPAKFITVQISYSDVIESCYEGSNPSVGHSWFNNVYKYGAEIGQTPAQMGLAYAGMMKSGIDIGNGVSVKFASIQPMTFDTQNPYAFDLYPFGYTGAAWVNGDLTERLIPKTATHALLDGVSVNFQNDTGQPWDTQFIAGERFTWMQAPVPIKDNLQTYELRARYYGCGVKRVVDWSAIASASVLIPECTTGSSPDPDFRDLDTVAYVTRVYDSTTATELTRSLSVSPPTGTYYMTSLGEFVFNAAQYGDTILLTYNYTVF